jgi:hypothetical protein
MFWSSDLPPFSHIIRYLKMIMSSYQNLTKFRIKVLHEKLRVSLILETHYRSVFIIPDLSNGFLFLCFQLILLCLPLLSHTRHITKYEACPESKDTNVLNMYNIFSLQKRHCE